jgi:transposase
VNGEGQPIRFSLTAGQQHDMTQAAPLLQDLSPKYVIADKSYDSDPFREQIRQQGAKPVIPSRAGCRRRHHDRVRYKLRNVVERFINRVKHYRRVATRYDKTDSNYCGFVCLASLVTHPQLNVNTT